MSLQFLSVQTASLPRATGGRAAHALLFCLVPRPAVSRVGDGWLCDVTRLQGDVHMQLALSERDAGKYDSAQQEFQQSDRAYRDAIAQAASDPENYKALARVSAEARKELACCHCTY